METSKICLNQIEHHHKLLSYIELYIGFAWCVLNHFDPLIMTAHILIILDTIFNNISLYCSPQFVSIRSAGKVSFGTVQFSSFLGIKQPPGRRFDMACCMPFMSPPMNIFFCPCLPYLWIVGGWGSGWRECRWHFGVVAITTATCSNTLCDIGRLQGSNLRMLGELMKLMKHEPVSGIQATWTFWWRNSDSQVLRIVICQSNWSWITRVFEATIYCIQGTPAPSQADVILCSFQHQAWCWDLGIDGASWVSCMTSSTSWPSWFQQQCCFPTEVVWGAEHMEQKGVYHCHIAVSSLCCDLYSFWMSFFPKVFHTFFQLFFGNLFFIPGRPSVLAGCPVVGSPPWYGKQIRMSWSKRGISTCWIGVPAATGNWKFTWKVRFPKI